MKQLLLGTVFTFALTAPLCAEAQQVQVQVGRVNGSARFVIADDGRGFDLNNVDGGQHLGLGIMRTRAERCGGSLDVVSTPGRGTTISATLPLAER